MQVFPSDPIASFLSTAVVPPLAATVQALARMVALPPAMMDDTTDKWVLGASQIVLSTRERAAWAGLPRSRRRRLQWMSGRVAVKDAIRLLVEERTGAVLHPAAIEVLADHRGAPFVALQHPAVDPSRLRVSIAHSAEFAVALVSDDAAVRGVGIDMEVERPRRALERKGMTPVERSALERLDDSERARMALRWWCAKEATAKALGTGLDLLGGAQSIVVSPLPGDGLVRVQIAASRDHAERCLRAATRQDAELVLATVVDTYD